MSWTDYFRRLVADESIVDLRDQIIDAACDVLTKNSASSLSVAKTGYFNHTFVPDIVISGSLSGDRYERHVYLRFDDRRWLADPVMAEDSPVIIGMRTHDEPLAYEAADPLVVSASGFEVFGERAERADSLTSVGFDVIAFGGSGVVDVPTASMLDSSLDLASAAASAEGPDVAIVQAMNLVGAIADNELSMVYGQSLFDLWVRAGKDVERFPGASPEELFRGSARVRLLISMLEAGVEYSDASWASVGAMVSLKTMLEELPSTSRLPLQKGIAALAGCWVGSIARVRRSAAGQLPSVELYKDRKRSLAVLRFVLPTMTIEIAADKRVFARSVADQIPPTVNDLRPVLGTREAQGVDVGAKVTIDLEGMREVDFEEIYRRRMDEAAGEFRVQKVKALTPGTARVVSIDYTTGTMVPSGGDIAVPGLLRAAATYFLAADEDRAALRAWGLSV